MKISQLIAMMIFILAISAVGVSAQSFSYNYSTPGTPLYMKVTDIDVNDFDDFPSGSILAVKRAETLEIKLTVEAGATPVEDAEIEAAIKGYRYSTQERDLITDYSDSFNLQDGRSKTFRLYVTVPADIDKEDLELRIRLTDRNNPTIEYLYTLDVEGVAREDAVQITKFYISPSEVVEAGRALSFKVVVENKGDRDYDDVSVVVAIPELNLRAYETIDELKADKTESFESLLIRIPSEAPAGEYEVVSTVEFDKYESTEVTNKITVVGREDVKTPEKGDGFDKTIVTMPKSVEVSKDATGTLYPININNIGTEAKTYVLSAKGTESWATTSFQPSSVVVVGAGKSQTAYLNIVAKQEAPVGDQAFQVVIATGDEVSTTNVLSTVAGDSSSSSSNSVLEWILVILVVILIVLALIVLITKLSKGNKEDEEGDDSQTYY